MSSTRNFTILQINDIYLLILDCTSNLQETNEPVSCEEDKHEDNSYLNNITWRTYVAILFSGTMYLLDVGSDLLLGIQYLLDHKQRVVGYLILSILVISSIICNLKSKFAIWKA